MRPSNSVPHPDNKSQLGVVVSEVSIVTPTIVVGVVDRIVGVTIANIWLLIQLVATCGAASRKEEDSFKVGY